MRVAVNGVRIAISASNLPRLESVSIARSKVSALKKIHVKQTKWNTNMIWRVRD